MTTCCSSQKGKVTAKGAVEGEEAFSEVAESPGGIKPHPHLMLTGLIARPVCTGLPLGVGIVPKLHAGADIWAVVELEEPPTEVMTILGSRNPSPCSVSRLVLIS